GREVVIRPVREVADQARVSADQIASELTDEGGDRVIAIRLRVALAPAVQPVRGLDLHEQPVLAVAGIDEERGDGGELHAPLSPRAGAAGGRVYYSRGSRGSSRSRKASPIRLKASTASMIASPENVVIHGQHLMYCRPSLRMLPQLGVGGGIPRPRNDKLASVRMAVAMLSVATTTSA